MPTQTKRLSKAKTKMITITREQLQALTQKQLTALAIDALRDATATGVQLPNKRKPRWEFYKQVLAEADRRRRQS